MRCGYENVDELMENDVNVSSIVDFSKDKVSEIMEKAGGSEGGTLLERIFDLENDSAEVGYDNEGDIVHGSWEVGRKK